jgi:DNA polymerase-3 subunit gamma/tau
VYIVDEAHMLTREAWNALLKILEEPPPNVVFVFATTEPQKIAQSAAPVMSRLQRFDFHRIGPTAIRARLRQVADAEGIVAEEDALTLIARQADGGMRDALSVLDQCVSFGEGTLTVRSVREILGLVDDELYGEVLSLVTEHKAEAVFPLIERLLERGADLGEFINGAAEMLRSMLMVQVGAQPEGLTEAMRQRIDQYAGVLRTGDVLRMLKLLADQEIAIRRSANPRLMVETLLLRWALMDRVVDLETALDAMRQGGGATAPGSGPLAPTGKQPAGRSPGPTQAATADPAGFGSNRSRGHDSCYPAGVAGELGPDRGGHEAGEPLPGRSAVHGAAAGRVAPNLALEFPEPNPVASEKLTRQRECSRGNPVSPGGSPGADRADIGRAGAGRPGSAPGAADVGCGRQGGAAQHAPEEGRRPRRGRRGVRFGNR